MWFDFPKERPKAGSRRIHGFRSSSLIVSTGLGSLGTFKAHSLGLLLYLALGWRLVGLGDTLSVLRLALSFAFLTFLLALGLALFLLRFLTPVDNVDDASEACTLHLGTDNNGAGLLGHGVMTTLWPQAPYGSEVYDIGGSSAANGGLSFATDYQAPASCSANHLRSVRDEIPPRRAIPCHHPRTIAYLEFYAALDGLRQHLELEEKAKTLCHVDGDYVAVQRLARLLKGLLVDRSHGEDVVSLGEVVDAMVLGGIGEDEVAAAQDSQVLGDGKGQRIRDWASLFGSVPGKRFQSGPGGTRSAGSLPDSVWDTATTL
ncbi:hypothetical protein MPH_00465 [Macrophomina phaseolina MS6]|uniref:Uncharacterized protein n=1 Tax=Macrophomina phaseolina (strain MS6) TaxID=1126212 RepID=K2S5H0_MACPH|nr:hypothetical protein MPH_00465 [Macrophomina phaseolina MS6]